MRLEIRKRAQGLPQTAANLLGPPRPKVAGLLSRLSYAAVATRFRVASVLAAIAVALNLKLPA